MPHNINQQMRQILSSITQPSVSDYLTTDTGHSENFYSLREAQVLIEQWRVHYNKKRPHSTLDYRPPAPVTVALEPIPLDEVPNMQ